ncbi:acetolactate synthase [Thermopirellula anaerolimosa]
MPEVPNKDTNETGKSGESYPGVRQFTVFLDDGPSRLADLLRRFEARNCRLVSFSLQRELGYTIARFILHPSSTGREVLERSGLPIVENRLLAVRLGPGPQPLLQICLPLTRDKVEVHAGQVIATTGKSDSIAIVTVNDVVAACEILRERGFHLLTEHDLFGPEEESDN